MRHLPFLLLLLFALSACKDETLSGYASRTAVWTLKELDGTPFTARATLSLATPGRVSGQAPCNSYSGAQSAPYPWFKAEEIARTEMACDDLQAEDAYFEALADMQISEVSGDVLILSNEAGRQMVFAAQRP